ncbi:helix-turn-helix domain-containing protein [Streptomyces fodineus]|uniref:helix-turn-helix domain-containing protein n=1 Tax=Streptomyces fodineus TaxID=1904616 RepID=UPI003AAE86CE
MLRGLKPPRVARALRVSRKSAYAWHTAWREGRDRRVTLQGTFGGAHVGRRPRP